jgi:hypothetical protein
MFIFSFLLQQSLAEPVLLPFPEIRGAATKAHVDEFFRMLTEELSTDTTITVRQISDLDPIRGTEAQKYMTECIPGEASGCAFSLADINRVPMLLSIKFESNKQATITIVRIANGNIVEEEIRTKSTEEMVQETVLIFTKVQNGTYSPPQKEGEEKEVEEKKEDEGVLDYKEYKLPPILLKSEEKEDVRLTRVIIEEMMNTCVSSTPDSLSYDGRISNREERISL